jgi:hypothetical protein
MLRKEMFPSGDEQEQQREGQRVERGQLLDEEGEQHGQSDCAERGERVGETDEQKRRAHGEDDVLDVVGRIGALHGGARWRRLHGGTGGRAVNAFERRARLGDARLFRRHARLLVVGRRAADGAEAQGCGNVRAAVATVHESFTPSFTPARCPHRRQQRRRLVGQLDEAACT